MVRSCRRFPVWRVLEIRHEQVEEAAKHGPFTSLENFRNQAKVSKTNVDKMVELGILTGLPETDQLTFDFFMEQSQV